MLTARALVLAAVASAGVPAQPVSIIQGDPLDCFSQVEGGAAISAARVDVEGPGFTRAWRVRSQLSANPWDLRIRCFNVLPVQQGDWALATFWIRTLSSASGKGFTTFVVERDEAPNYEKHASWTAAAGGDWRRVQVPWKFPYAYGAAGAPYNLSFWVTFDPQEIEIGGISVMNYGPNASLSDLGFTYDGAASDAPWRAAAAERIERIRKADIVVVARDAQGNPIANAPVRVRMKKHAFGWGTAVAGGTLQSNARYREELLRNFNKVVTENDLKWPFYEAGWGKANAAYELPWFKDNGIAMVRGHNVIWPDKNNLPADVAASLDAQPVDKDALRSRIYSHIADVMAFARDSVTEWDVLNEPYTSRDVQKALGDEEMAVWFQKAREADPSVKLYVNDYGILSSGGYNLPHQNAYFDTIKLILDHGGPLDGIGFQSHFNMNVTPPDRVLEILDRFASFGTDLQITEFDLDLADEKLQAQYTRDFMTAVFSHPAVKGFVMWGFWAGAHWLPRAAMFREDWSTRPNYDVWRDLVYNQWWTDVSGTTGADGVFRTRGFLGDYDVEITAGGRTDTSPLAVATGRPNYTLIGLQRAGTFAAAGVVNAASFRPGNGIAPGEIIEIWGGNFGPRDVVVAPYDSSTGLARYAGDTRVLIDGRPVPLIHVLTEGNVGRVAAVVPYSVTGAARIQVEYLGTLTAAIDVPVVAAAPGIFLMPDGRHAVAVMHRDDGTLELNSDARPARRGWYLELYITGEGLTDPVLSDGMAPPSAPFPRPVAPVVVTFGGVESHCPDNWAGLVYAGVTQVNACVPDGAPSGAAVPVEVSVGGVASPATAVAIE